MTNKNVILIIYLFFFGINVHAETQKTSPDNPFIKWAKCPKNVDALNNVIKEFTDNDSAFENLSSSEKMKIIKGTNWQAIYLRHIGSYLLPSNMQSGFAKSCWMYFKAMQDAIGIKDLIEMNKNNFAWSSCLKSKYSPVPNELLQISKCVQDLYISQGFNIPPGKYKATTNTQVCASGEVGIIQDEGNLHFKIDNTYFAKYIDSEKFDDVVDECTLTYTNKSTTEELINTVTERCLGKPLVVRETTIRKGENKFSYTIKVKVDKAPQVQTYSCELVKE